MADVFAVGVFIAYLGSKASNMLDASLEIGFYYFTGSFFPCIPESESDR